LPAGGKFCPLPARRGVILYYASGSVAVLYLPLRFAKTLPKNRMGVVVCGVLLFFINLN